MELRVLEGPNIYFTRPAIKLTLSVPGWMRAPDPRLARLAARLGLPAIPRPGPPGSEQRLRFAARAAAHLTRLLARASGTTRLAVRGRRGPGAGQVVVAFPWRRQAAAEALGRRAARLFGSVLGSRSPVDRLLAQAAEDLEGIPPGPAPSVLVPDIPVIAVTGTNGKTTTVRLLAHIARCAGKKVAYSSTDGVYVDDVLVEAGDYSGPGGAARALLQNPDVAVLETARGGILLRGIGTDHNDVAVVTNVQADHIGLHGIQTLDQLAEVKAAITRITRPDGWDVLNGDDPRVLAMRRGASGRPFVVSVDPDHPAIRAVLNENGRAMAPLDGRLTLFGPGSAVRSLLPVEDVPLTLAGISSHNIRNAMAAAAAALGIGLPEAAVVRGLRTFVTDPQRNPGRANLFEDRGRVLLIDYAHNEDGMRGVVEICRGLRRPGAEIWITYCAAGDRTPEIMRGIGFVAAVGADHVAIGRLARYTRGRDPDEIVAHLRAGAVEAGVAPRDVPDFPDEVRALRSMLRKARPGDVVAIAALGQRPEIFELLAGRGARRIGPARVKQLVRRARGTTRRPPGRGAPVAAGVKG